MPAVRDALFAQADTALVNGRFTSDAFLRKFAGSKRKKGEATVNADAPLFTIKGKAYPTKDFLAYVQQAQRPRPGAEPRFVMQQLYNQFTDQSLTEFERTNLDTKYEDYRMLVKEYRDGILLFQLMDEKVWSKALTDTVGLQQFFTANQANYQWGPRVQATVVGAASAALLAQAQQQMATGRYAVTRNAPALVAFQTGQAKILPPSQSALDALAARLTQDSTLTLAVTGRVKRGETAPLAQRRAAAIANYLTDKGVASRQISTKTTAAPAANATALLALTTSNVEALEETLNQKNPLAVQIVQQSFQQGDNKVVDEVMARGPGTYPVQKDGRFYAVTIEKVLPAGPKALNEARGQATSDYQAYLEKEWLNTLRTQYPVKVNQGEVDKLVTK
jgi:peptidyl-prolyl cis-trans isomerase SurA